MSDSCRSCGQYFETSGHRPRECKICHDNFCDYHCCSSYDDQFNRYDICAICGYRYKGKHPSVKETSSSNDDCVIC